MRVFLGCDAMDFIPLTESDKKALLAKIGVNSVEELFVGVEPKLKRDLNVEGGLSESELSARLHELSGKNKACTLFRGGGAYNHYVPAALNHVLLRGEFYTAYTPYQPEVSQGTLQAIYEFQTYVCLLAGMDVANASMYEAGSACAEAINLARGETGRNKVVIGNKINPEYARVIQTYADACGFEVVGLIDGGVEAIDESVACVVVQTPNYFGCIEDLCEWKQKASDKGALLVVCVNDATSLALLKPPGECGADVVVGDLQAFGNGLSFGGPYGAFMAVRKEHIKRIPGRLVGKTADTDGKEGFVLTLQAREQHIRREKASSNICSNQSLNALAATIYLALMGRTGLANVAKTSFSRAHKLQQKLTELGFTLAYNTPFYNEFAVHSPVEVKKLNEKLLENGIVGGIELGEKEWLLACTELTTEKDIEEFVSTVKEVL